jgi:mono/diheme cytochrome c family protein
MMVCSNWTAVAALCMLATFTERAAGQTSKTGIKVTKAPPAVASVPSTLSGVYTDAQATRGRYVYIGGCKYCHSPETHTGAIFAKWWRGKQLSDLYSYVLEQMPKNDPGSLAPEDVADVVAYLLKLNAMPVGKQELYPDVDSLKKYRIEMKPSSTSTAKRNKP